MENSVDYTFIITGNDLLDSALTDGNYTIDKDCVTVEFAKTFTVITKSELESLINCERLSDKTKDKINNVLLKLKKL